MKRIVTTMLATALLAAAGCALMGPEYVEPAEYDLAQPPAAESASLSAPVRFGVFRNVSGADDTYDEIFSEYTALPEGVEQGVYQRTFGVNTVQLLL